MNQLTLDLIEGANRSNIDHSPLPSRLNVPDQDVGSVQVLAADDTLIASFVCSRNRSKGLVVANFIKLVNAVNLEVT